MEDKDFFDVKISYQTQDKFVAYRNGKWEDLKLPKGHGLAMSVSLIDPEHVNEDVIKLLNVYRVIKTIPDFNFVRYQRYIQELNLQSHVDSSVTWENRINKLQHKLDAIKFHMKNFNLHQQEIQDKFEKEYVNSIIEVEELDPVFTYELESFLFQVQSALDILGQIIALATKEYTFDSYGIFLSTKLSNSNSFNPAMNTKLQKVIVDNNKWYESFNAMRNLVTHWGDLLNFKSTTHKPAIDKEFARIYYPQMPDKNKVTRYMNEVWTSLSNLITEVGTVLKEEIK